MKATGMTLQRRGERELVTVQHGEAFALMKYQNKVTGRIEWLWNSRDGVTPFVIDDPLCPELHKTRFREAQRKPGFDPRTEPDPGCMAHADWHEDAFLPNYVPTEGTRIFMSWPETPESYKAAVRERWSEYLERVRKESPEAAESMAKGEPYQMEATSPCVVVVTPALVDYFHELAKDRPFVPPPRQPVGPKLITPADKGFGDFTAPLNLKN